MENKRKHTMNPFIRTVVFFAILLVLLLAGFIGLRFLIFSIPEPEGLSPASWPATFADNFSLWMSEKDGELVIDDIGLERLDSYGLWLQVIDESGQEVFSQNKPETGPQSYTASQLVSAIEGADTEECTVYAGTFSQNGCTWSYFVGFPYAIGETVIYYNGEVVSRLQPLVKGLILAGLLCIGLLILGYGLWLSRKLSMISLGIQDLSLRTYKPVKEKGVFKNIYQALNKIDGDIRRSDKLAAETDQARNEWIANITHDLKTPLSPIKGYGELLAEHPETEAKNARAYGTIILKNVRHTEALINDLKLTYQLDSGTLPCHFQEVELVRYIRELVIDMINDPAFSKRNVSFDSDAAEVIHSIDPQLFRRALQNLITNALVHNPEDTAVEISIQSRMDDQVHVFIRDNGVGMEKDEIEKLFSRYYRGTNTREKSEGTGLGLAIARQIITLHGGEITVKSQPGKGTEFKISI